MNSTTRDTPRRQASGDASRRRFLRGAAAAGLGATAGCVSVGRSGSGGGGHALTVGYQPFYAEAWSALVIKHAGLAEKYLPEGYTVSNWQIALQGAVIGNRMIAGKNQIGYTGDMPSITAIANDRTPISCVALGSYSKGQQCSLAVVPKDSDVTHVSDLDGETFSLTTGSCAHRFALRFAQKEGLDYTVKDQGINTILSSIRDGSATVGFGWEPVMYRLVRGLGEARYLLTGAPYDVYDASSVIVPDSFVEHHREAAKQWLKAELEAKHIMATNPERTVDLVREEQDLKSYDRSTLKGCLYGSVSTAVEDVERARFVTDYERADPAARLLKERGPKFLKQQGAIEAVPDASRFRADLLDEAVGELRREVDWRVRRAG